MQKYSNNIEKEERVVIRKWRLWVTAFYGSIVAILVALSSITNHASQQAAQDEVALSKILRHVSGPRSDRTRVVCSPALIIRSRWIRLFYVDTNTVAIVTLT
jgi:hypothetical protein